jgi:four helix bundle protein
MADGGWQMADGEGSSAYRKLEVWQEAMTLVELVYKLAQKLPPDERYGLISQMQRAAVSVPANIAEGSGRYYPAEYVRYLLTARGSLMELETHVLIAERLKLVTVSDNRSFWTGSQRVGRLLNGLIRALKDKSRATATAANRGG